MKKSSKTLIILVTMIYLMSAFSFIFISIFDGKEKVSIGPHVRGDMRSFNFYDLSVSTILYLVLLSIAVLLNELDDEGKKRKSND